MSLPRLLGNIKRAQRIFVEAFDDHGIRVEYECEGYEAVAVQHEIDHLDGILFPDRVKSPSDLMERQVRTEGSPTRDDSRRIQAVFFDLDATLLDDSEAIGRAWNAFRKSCEGKGLGGDWEKLKRVHERHAWQQWVLGDNPEHHDAPETILEKAWVLTLQEEPREGFAFPDELARDFVACMEEAWKLYEEVPPVLDALLGRVRLAVVTNGGTDFQNRKFKRLGLKQWFEAMFVSQTHGFTKPDPRLFLTACRSLGVEPGRCLMVGDSWERDVEGGLAAGLKACWLDRSGKGLSKKLPESTGLITRLTELIPWMDRFES
jgi:HAD superfamily hydrolase (TIGR01509 family)